MDHLDNESEKKGGKEANDEKMSTLGMVWSLLSHASILFPLIICYKLKDSYAVVKLCLTLIISLFYHTCRDVGWCLLGASLELWRRADHVYADTTVLLILFFILIDITLQKSNSMSGRNVHFLIVTEMTITALATIVIFLSIGPDFNSALVIASACAILFISRLQWIEWNNAKNRIEARFLYTGLALAAVALAVFIAVPESSEYYQVAHGFWHWTVFPAIGFLKLGTTAHLRAKGTGWLGLTINEDDHVL